ncbi:MAG: CvpA family protein [Chloroflexota bacterium]|nr:CvpA family protein [Chloroflexia bacterium]MDQ3167886.1 CvpA family protein [Chloroflexota bacterium]MDQ3513352.1 CvpA family protein [Chloroflexota bacterium]
MPNFFDIVILISFMALVGAGFFNGVTRLSAAIVAVYFGAILAAVFYRPLTTAAIDVMPSIGRVTGELVVFFMLFLGFSVAFTVAMARWLGGMRLPRRLRILDNIGGALLGIVVAGLALTVTSMLLAITLQVMNQVVSSGSSPAANLLDGGIRGSALVPVFLRLAPFFVQAIAPWFPGGVPPILERVG